MLREQINCKGVVGNGNNVKSFHKNGIFSCNLHDYTTRPTRIQLEPLKKIPLNCKYKNMGCASSQASTVTMSSGDGNEGNNGTAPSDPVQSPAEGLTTHYPPAESFEIPLDDQIDMNESIIKKHPPKRLQRLTETAVQPTTIEGLEEKLAKAEIRRQKYLQQRIEGAYSSTATKILDDDDDEENNDGENSDGLSENNDNIKMKNSKNLKKNESDEENFGIEETKNRDWTRTE